MWLASGTDGCLLSVRVYGAKTRSRVDDRNEFGTGSGFATSSMNMRHRRDGMYSVDDEKQGMGCRKM